MSVSAEITAFAEGQPSGFVVIGTSDGRVGTWNGLDTAVTLHKVHDDSVLAVGAPSNTREIVSLSSKGAVGLTTMANGATKRLPGVDLQTAPVSTAVFSVDRGELLTGGRHGEIRIFETSSGKLRRLLTGHRADLYTLALQPSAPALASTAADADLRIWDLSTGRQLHLADNDLSMIAAVFNPRDGSLLAGGTDRRITLRTANDWKAQSLITLPAPEIVNALAWSPNAATIAVGSVDDASLAKGWVRLIDPAKRSVSAELDTRGQPAWWVAFVDDDTVVASVSSASPMPTGQTTSFLHAWDR